MGKLWSFGQKLSAGFAIIVLLTLVISAVSLYTLRQVISSKDNILAVYVHNLIEAERLHTLIEEKAVEDRAFLLAKDEGALKKFYAAQEQANQLLKRLQSNINTFEERQLISQIEKLAREHQLAIEAIVELRKGDTPLETITKRFLSDPYLIAPDQLGSSACAKLFSRASGRGQSAGCRLQGAVGGDGRNQ